MKTTSIVAFLSSCLMTLTLASAQTETGIMVLGDVYIASGSQVAIHADLLTLETDLQGDGELIMAAKSLQRINGKGHSINRLKINNILGVALVSDLIVTTALTILQGELKLIDACLIVPTDGVINSHDYHNIYPIGKGVLIIKSHKQPITQTGSTSGSFHKFTIALVSDNHLTWAISLPIINPLLLTTTQTFVLSNSGKVPSPPPKLCYVTSFITSIYLFSIV